MDYAAASPLGGGGDVASRAQKNKSLLPHTSQNFSSGHALSLACASRNTTSHAYARFAPETSSSPPFSFSRSSSPFFDAPRFRPEERRRTRTLHPPCVFVFVRLGRLRFRFRFRQTEAPRHRRRRRRRRASFFAKASARRRTRRDASVAPTPRRARARRRLPASPKAGARRRNARGARRNARTPRPPPERGVRTRTPGADDRPSTFLAFRPSRRRRRRFRRRRRRLATKAKRLRSPPSSFSGRRDREASCTGPARLCGRTRRPTRRAARAAGGTTRGASTRRGRRTAKTRGLETARRTPKTTRESRAPPSFPRRRPEARVFAFAKRSREHFHFRSLSRDVKVKTPRPSRDPRAACPLPGTPRAERTPWPPSPPRRATT